MLIQQHSLLLRDQVSHSDDCSTAYRVLTLFIFPFIEFHYSYLLRTDEVFIHLSRPYLTFLYTQLFDLK